MFRLFLPLFLLATFASQAQPIAVPGQPLPAWQEGYLDLHHINTGRGNAAFYILPDGTSILFDAGELDPTAPRTTSPRNTPIRPDNSRPPYEWIASYIRQVAPSGAKNGIDYALISHFHDDHFGSWYPSIPLSADKKFALSGITGVAELLGIHKLLTRDYHYPFDPKIALSRLSKDNPYLKTWMNYLAFLDDQRSKGMVTEFLKAGSRSQIHLLNHPETYSNFYIQNVKSNGWIWTGKDSSIQQHFPPIDTAIQAASTAKPAQKATLPDENSLSNVLVIHYGPFSYYTGGDCPGNIFLGDSAWRDVETPVAQAVGSVDVATMDHHGNRDAMNEFFVKTLRPRVWIEQVWTADHPGHEVLIRATSPLLYKGPRDLFATNMMEANHLVIGPLVDNSYRSLQGHILVRVLPGGKTYYIITLDDSRPELLVKSVFGPYTSKYN